MMERYKESLERVIVILLALTFLIAAQGRVQSQGTDTVKPARISGPEMSALIRNTVITVNNANVTGNYSVLRALGTRDFQDENTEADLAVFFKELRDADFNLSGLTLIDPVIVGAPTLSADGVLEISGIFNAVPFNLVFAMVFGFENKHWRIASLAINLVERDQ